MRTVVAVDVGGTTIKGAVVDETGRVLWREDSPTPVDDGPDEVVRRVRAVVAALVAHPTASAVTAVGVVAPGSVDPATGLARFAANIGWRDVPLRDLVARDTGLPTTLDHDVRAAGIAEASLGRLTGPAESLLVVIGTGIAGLLTVAGRPVPGATGLAGEIGHLPIWPDGELCPCGQRGCLERYASAAGISRRYHAATGLSATATEIGVAATGAKRVAAQKTQPDAAAQVWADAVDALALGLASCTMMLDPALIVVGGGLSQAGPLLLTPLRLALAERVIWRPAPVVELSALGGRAGLLGAAILAAGRAGFDVGGWRLQAADEA
jgi:glucokinase